MSHEMIICVDQGIAVMNFSDLNHHAQCYFSNLKMKIQLAKNKFKFASYDNSFLFINKFEHQSVAGDIGLSQSSNKNIDFHCFEALRVLPGARTGQHVLAWRMGSDNRLSPLIYSHFVASKFFHWQCYCPNSRC